MMIVVVLVSSGCASQPKNQIMLMPAPDVFDQGDRDPFTDRNPIKDIPYGGILFATDREPAIEDRQYYLDDRGHVILTGSDPDLHLFGSYRVDGVLDVVDDLTIYASAKDKALGMSKWVFGRDRVGQIVSVDLSGAAAVFLRQNSKLIIVNTTDTPGADTGNGHAYFRQSPSTSSDILATLMFDLKPGERGLEQANGGPIWTSRSDYIDRLRAAVIKARSN
jgi:hypothetical protein